MRFSLCFPSVLLLCCSQPALQAAESTPPYASAAERIPFQVSLAPVFPNGARIAELVDRGDYPQALTLLKLSTPRRPHEQLLRAVLLLETGEPDAALKLLHRIESSLPTLHDHVLVLRGDALFRLQRIPEAVEALKLVPLDSPLLERSLLLVATAELSRNRPDAAVAALERLSNNRPLMSLSLDVLWTEAQALQRQNKPESFIGAVEHYRTISIQFPLSAKAAKASQELQNLAGQGYAAPPLSSREKFTKGQLCLDASYNEDAVNHLQPLFDNPDQDSNLTCDVSYSLGLALQNMRRYTDATAPLIKASQTCDADRQVKALYRLGRGQIRRNSPSLAEPYLRNIIDRFPDHSFADDALFILGCGYQEAGDLDQGARILNEQIRRFPSGDMRAEAGWRLAWIDFRNGELEKALTRITASLADARSGPPNGGSNTPLNGADTPESAEVAVLNRIPAGFAGKVPPGLAREGYWRVRWMEALGSTAHQTLVSEYADVVRNATTDFYGVLAWQRLNRLDNGHAKKLLGEFTPLLSEKVTQSPVDLTTRPAAFTRAAELLRAGLRKRAVEELLLVNAPSLIESDRMLLSYFFSVAKRFDLSHRMPRKILERSAETQVIAENRLYYTLAFPMAFETELAPPAKKYGVDAQLMLALAREESALNPEIRSWAGAIGLVQLMPATARAIGKQVGKSNVSAADLVRPDLNAELGTKYMSNLLKMFGNHPGLAIPGYNAGEGAVKKWLKLRGQLPFDEFVEEIPYKQTRDYAKRVLATYQTYHFLYRRDKPFITIPLNLPTK